MQDAEQRFHRFLYVIILAQFVAITLLLFAMSNEYFSNAYMQTWINTNAPYIGILLHGELDTLFIGMAIGLTFLLIQHRHSTLKSEPVNEPMTGKVPDYFAAPAFLSKKIKDDIELESTPILRKKRVAGGLPEEILVELEKTDV